MGIVLVNLYCHSWVLFFTPKPVLWRDQQQQQRSTKTKKIKQLIPGHTAVSGRAEIGTRWSDTRDELSNSISYVYSGSFHECRAKNVLCSIFKSWNNFLYIIYHLWVEIFFLLFSLCPTDFSTHSSQYPSTSSVVGPIASDNPWAHIHQNPAASLSQKNTYSSLSSIFQSEDFQGPSIWRANILPKNFWSLIL